MTLDLIRCDLTKAEILKSLIDLDLNEAEIAKTVGVPVDRLYADYLLPLFQSHLISVAGIDDEGHTMWRLGSADIYRGSPTKEAL